MEGLDDDIRRVMARNAEILECRRQLQHWSERLSTLEAEQRREYVLGAMESDPRGTWERLTEQEKQDKEFAIKALTYTPSVFGEYPFETSEQARRNKHVQLPHKFRYDRDAVLAYLSSSTKSLLFFRESFCVDKAFMDDTEVMTLVVARCRLAINRASPRLLNDHQFVISALTDESRTHFLMLQHISVHLRSSKDFMLELLESSDTKKNMQGWNLSPLFLYSELSIEDEKELALATLERSQRVGEKCVGYLSFASEAVCDDKDFMLKFVSRNWRALLYCSDRLRSDEEVVKAAVSQTIKAARYALGPYKNDWLMAEKRMVIEELEEDTLDFDDIPAAMKSDPEVIVAALKAKVINFNELSREHCMNRSIVLEYTTFAEEDFFRFVPDDLQRDETMCLEMLKAGYHYPKDILEAIPSFNSSREAILAITESETNHFWDIPGIISRSSFRDDREVLLSACKQSPHVVEHASARLRSDREFISEALRCSEEEFPIMYTSEEFQMANIDLVVRAIKLCSESLERNRRFISGLARPVWQRQSVVLAFLENEWPVLGELSTGNPLLDDADIVREAVQISPAELQYASQRLKGDREFVLSLVKSNGRSLVHADAQLRNDDDILLAAVADTPAVLFDCFGSGSNEDFESAASFASRVRSMLEVYETYMSVFLGGISVSPSSARSHLPLLDRGIETSVAFKKLIAEFACVPIGGELLMLRKASLNLRKLGY